MVVKYFGELEDVTGKSDEEIELKNAHLSSLKTYLIDTYPLNLERCRIAVNHKLVEWDADLELSLKDEVAILSPFAGG